MYQLGLIKHPPENLGLTVNRTRPHYTIQQDTAGNMKMVRWYAYLSINKQLHDHNMHDTVKTNLALQV